MTRGRNNKKAGRVHSVRSLPLQFARALQEFLDYLRLAGGRTDGTCEAYRRDLQSYLIFTRDRQIKRINEITPETVGAFMSSPAVQKKKSSLLVGVM